VVVARDVPGRKVWRVPAAGAGAGDGGATVVAWSPLRQVICPGCRESEGEEVGSS